MEVTKIVDEDIAAKVDTQYVEDQLNRVQNVGLLYTVWVAGVKTRVQVAVEK